jgi:hypothetical protein
MTRANLLRSTIIVLGWLWVQQAIAEPPQPASCSGNCQTNGSSVCPGTNGPQPASSCYGNCQGCIPILWGCPDDYCPKPMPGVPCIRCGEPDDYCRKPCPHIIRLSGCGGPCDYDRKPCPPACRPMCTSNYICIRLRQCSTTPCQQQPSRAISLPVSLEDGQGQPKGAGKLGPLPDAAREIDGLKPVPTYHPR